MGIGTSLGAYFDDAFHHQAGINTDPSIDNSEINPDVSPIPGKDVKDFSIIRAGKKDQMPFPDNNNPDTDFKSRFGNLPPSGILNDLKKPTDPVPPLVRRISYRPGEDDTNTAENLALSASEKARQAVINNQGDLGRPATSDADVGNVFPQTAQEYLQTGKIRYTDEEREQAESLGLRFMGNGAIGRSYVDGFKPGRAPLRIEPTDMPMKSGPDSIAPRGSAEELEAALGPSPAEQVIRSLRRQTPVEGENMEAVMRRVHDTATPVNESFDELMARLDREDALAQEAREAGSKNFKDYGKVQVADRGYGSFLFKTEDSKVLPLRVTERNNGKTLYVNWVGDEMMQSVNTFSKSTIRGLFKALADKYPNAEEVAGFRVSGARSGAPDVARMKIPGRGKKEPQRKSIDDLSREWDETIE